MNITTIDTVAVPGYRTKFTWLHVRVRKLAVGKTLVVEYDTINECRSADSSVRQKFKFFIVAIWY
jgi:hypothetical protein